MRVVLGDSGYTVGRSSAETSAQILDQTCQFSEFDWFAKSATSKNPLSVGWFETIEYSTVTISQTGFPASVTFIPQKSQVGRTMEPVVCVFSQLLIHLLALVNYQ